MIHVYIVPRKRSNGYCFGGPVPIQFENVDWMDDPPPEIGSERVKEDIMQKIYVRMASHGTSFLVLGPSNRPELTFQFEV